MAPAIPLRNRFAISEVAVEELFGEYSYHFKSDDQLLILYGENGCGKTTLLRLIYNLLSPGLNQGHRTSIANIKFRSLRIVLADNTSITAKRDANDLIGAFNLSFIANGACIETSVTVSGDPLAVKRSDQSREYEAIYDSLAKKLILLHYLADDRRTELSSDSNRALRELTLRKGSTGQHFYEEDAEGEEGERPIDRYLRHAIRRAHEQIRTQALSATNKGELNTHSIYSNVVELLANVSGDAPLINVSRVPGVISILNAIASQSMKLAKHSLTAPLRLQPLLNALDRADDQGKSLICDVLQPYADSLQARLDALEDTYTLIDALVENVNAFYRTKKIRFDLLRGLRIIWKSQVLRPSQLSSGEKQLLLLLCSTVAARKAPCIVIIDEPEISLNVKWQRTLVKALLDCARDCGIQFIFATHSLDLLADYMDNVRKLESSL